MGAGPAVKNSRQSKQKSKIVLIDSNLASRPTHKRMNFRVAVLAHTLILDAHKAGKALGSGVRLRCPFVILTKLSRVGIA